jgi:hypothetical protein
MYKRLNRPPPYELLLVIGNHFLPYSLYSIRQDWGSYFRKSLLLICPFLWAENKCWKNVFVNYQFSLGYKRYKRYKRWKWYLANKNNFNCYPQIFTAINKNWNLPLPKKSVEIRMAKFTHGHRTWSAGHGYARGHGHGYNHGPRNRHGHGICPSAR